jgi:hypothetical protein
MEVKIGNAEYEVPEVFEDEMFRLAAHMDWARAFSERSDYFMAADELKGAARWAKELAKVCEEFAVNAQRMNARQMSKIGELDIGLCTTGYYVTTKGATNHITDTAFFALSPIFPFEADARRYMEEVTA